MHLRWEKGGEADVRRLDGEAIALVSTTSSPPGSRPSGVLNDGAPVRIKVHACKRQEDGTFVVEGRVIDLTRELRARLSGLAGEGGGA